MRKQELILATIVILLLLSVFFSRFYSGHSMIISDDIYSDLIGLENINVFSTDLFQMSLTGSFPWTLITLSLVFGIGTMVFFSLILKHYKVNDNLILIVGTIMVLSPQFISAFTISFRTGFSLFLLILSYYLLIKRKKLLNLIGYLILIIFSSLNFFNIIITLALLFSLKYVEKRRFSPAWILIGLFFVYYLPFIIKTGIPYFMVPVDVSYITELFSDFGGIYGLSLFKFLLATRMIRRKIRVHKLSQSL